MKWFNIYNIACIFCLSVCTVNAENADSHEMLTLRESANKPSLYTNTCNFVSYNGTSKEVSTKIKTGKIKYSKSILYQGEMSEKQPCGRGLIEMYSQCDKNNAFIKIEGDFSNNIVSDASIYLSGGLVFQSEHVEYIVSSESGKEELCLEIPKSILLFNNKNARINETIRLKGCRSTKETSSHYEIDNSYVHGALSSNFLQNDQVIRIIDLSGLSQDDIASQSIGFFLKAEKLENLDDKVFIDGISTNDLYFNNGLKVIILNDYCRFTYPNGNYIKIDNSNMLLDYRITCSDGVAELTNSETTIKYQDGDFFKSNNKKALDLAKTFLGACMNVKDLRILNGELQANNGIVSYYEDGNIVSTKYPLSGGGYYMHTVDNCDKLFFSNGDVFSASVPGGLRIDKGYSEKSSLRDFTLLNGTLKDPSGNETKYQNGYISIETVNDLRRSLSGDLSVSVIRTADNHPLSRLECTFDCDFVFHGRDFAKQLSDGLFYILVEDNLCLSYPKSYITNSGTYMTMLTCKSDEVEKRKLYKESYFYDNYDLVWVYRPTVNKDHVQYGKTENLYLSERKSGKIVCDLSETINKGKNNSFRKIHTNGIYHEKGRLENCFECSGKGYVIGWRDHDTHTCHRCGGKGMYIEHYW